VTFSLFISLPVLLAGAVLAVALRSNRASAAAALFSQAVASVCVILGVVPVLRGGAPIQLVWVAPRPLELVQVRIDALGAFFLSWSLPMTLLGTLYAVAYLRPYFARGRQGGSHFALLNMIGVSYVLIYTVENALVFLLGWEIAAVAAWLLVIWDYPSQKIRFAGFNYLVSTHVGLFLLVAAFMSLHGKTESMDFQAFGAFLSVPSRARGTMFLLLCAAFALKSAFFPFHTWLPRAHAAAPAHVSALMSGVIHKAGLFGFLRFSLLMGKPEEWMGWAVLGFGALSAFFGVLHTSTQRDLKRLLGYSSTENVGIAAMGFGAGYLGWAWGVSSLMVCGFAGGILHIFNHALFKCLSFYAAGAVHRMAHTVDLERLGGLAKRMPLTAAAFLLGGAAGSALPPLNGFVSELTIYMALLSGSAPTGQANAGLVFAASALAFTGGVGALAMTRAFGIAFLGQPRDASVVVTAEAPAAMLLPMVCHAAAVALVGVAPELGLGLTRAALALFPSGADVDLVLAPLSAAAWASRLLAALLLGVGLLRFWQGRRARRSVTWGCGYTAPSPRMQYTASSFTEHLARVFEPILPVLRRERRPHGLFPASPGQLATHHADAVERRIFEALGRGEDLLVQASDRIPEQPRFAFAAGLITLVVVGALVLARGALP
jgi:hydrogenase-4 component B